MLDASPHESGSESLTQRSAPRKSTRVPRIIVRFLIGACGAIFVALAVSGGLSTSHIAPNPLGLVIAAITGGIVIGWLAFSRDVLWRVIAWVTAAVGAGCLATEILPQWIANADFKMLGTYISFDDIANIVAAVFGAILGMYARPKSAT